MSALLVVLLFLTFMQGLPSDLPLNPPVNPPATTGNQQPAPGPSGPSTSTNTTSTSMTAETFGTLLYDGGGVAAGKLAKDGFTVINTIWSLPDFITNSRKPENTVDQPEAAQLNDDLVKLLAGFVLIGFALVIGYQALSVLRGEVPNPFVAVGALSVVAIAALAAVNNRELQRFPIDLVDVILTTISGAPIRDFVKPGFHLSAIVSPIWAALFALALILVTLGLTVILFIEGAWCIVLGALLGLAAFGVVLPIFGGGCQFLLRRWMGSLFSPVIVFGALRLASPSTQMIAGTGAPDLGLQLLMIAFLIVAWQAPGMMVGAIAVSFPGVAQMYLAGRLIGVGRFTERGLGSAGSNSASSGGPGAGGSRPEPPHRISTRGLNRAGAATNKLQWA